MNLLPISVLRSVASEDISMGRFAFPSRKPFWGSVVYGDRVRCAGMRLFVSSECSYSGCSRQKVSDRTEQRLIESVTG
jgi:hypothetical protein